MNIILMKLGGYWRIAVNGAVIRTPYQDSSPRALIVAYALRAFPGAVVVEDDLKQQRLNFLG